MPSYAHPLPDPVIVVGAGCIGLTTAVRLLQAGYPVLVLADHLPHDSLNPASSSSTAAGAHHLSFADNADWRQRFFDQRTYDILWEESQDAEVAARRGLMRLTQTEFYAGDEKHIRFLEQLPDFKVLPSKDLPEWADHSCSFTSITIEPSRYMTYLLSIVSSLGGVVQRVPRLEQLAHAATYAKRPQAITNCTGLGARTLQDVNDLTVEPVRGQVICLNAPWVRSGWTRQIGSLSGGEGGQRTYIIPRASGDVIIGGTRDLNDWETKPRQETTDDIIKRACEICPQLAHPPDAVPGTPVDLKKYIKAVVVGFRPTRQAGIRLELDPRLKVDGKIPVVHNYGHGGYGWQSCWASAEEAQRIVGEAIRSSGQRMAKL